MRLFVALAAAIIAASTAPAHAAKGTVAVFPAVVINGAAGNGAVVSEALRASLKSKGFTVLDNGTVNSAVRKAGLDTKKQQNIQSLAEFRKAAGADYVVYPRVMSVGQGVNIQGFQANVLVNVLGSWSKGFAHTRQVGQVFKGSGKPEQAVIGRSDANTAVGKLMQGFYAKVK
jgi:hypothetical protein